MVDVNRIKNLAEQVVGKLIKKGQTIAFAESMTGGLLASEITGVADASKVLKESFVVYADQAKIRLLHCQPSTIKRYSVYSFEVIKEMISGLSIESNADILVAVSGIAGPKTYNHIELGSVYIGIKFLDDLYLYKEKFNGDRQDVRYKTVEFIFDKILNMPLSS